MSECRKSETIPPRVQSFLASCTNLPSLPSVVVKIIEASKDPDTGVAEVAEIIQIDPVLSAKLLKVSNSSMYARRREITNLREAMALLGLNASLIIALSFSLVRTLNSNSDNNFNYDDFWKRSILSATIARQIGAKLKLPNLEDLFMAGLLQDIGILAMDSCQNEIESEQFSTNHFCRLKDEQDALGIDHSDIGAWLLKSWNLPEKLYKAVLCSHVSFSKQVETYEEEIFFQCVSLSGNLTDIWIEEDRESVIERNAASIETLLGYDREQLNQLICEVDNLLPEICNMFEIKIFDDIQRENILSEARDILLERHILLNKQCEYDQKLIKTLSKKTR